MVWKESAVFFFFFSLKHRFPTPSRFQTSFFLLFPPYCLSLSPSYPLPSDSRPSSISRATILLPPSVASGAIFLVTDLTRAFCLASNSALYNSSTLKAHVSNSSYRFTSSQPRTARTARTARTTLALTNLYLVSCVDRIPPSSSIFSLPSYSSFPFHSPPSSTWRSNHQRLVSLLYRLSDLLQ